MNNYISNPSEPLPTKQVKQPFSRRESALSGLRDTIRDFYLMGDASGPVETLTMLLSEFFDSRKKGEDAEDEEGFNASFREASDIYIGNMVHETGVIITFITRLREDWERAKEYFPEDNDQ